MMMMMMISSRVISNHVGAMYIETSYIIICNVMSSHMGAMYIEAPYIIISKVMSSHMGAMYIETSYKTAVPKLGGLLSLHNYRIHECKIYK